METKLLQTIGCILAVLTGEMWRPRFDRHGRCYMWIRNANSA